MITSTIKFSQIEDRIDAEYYKPEYLEAFSILEKYRKQGEMKSLESLSRIITKGETPLWRGDVYVKRGTPFLRVVNFVGENLDLSDIVYIPEFVHKRMKRSQLRPGDILLSMAGRIGTAVVVPEELKIANINQAIAKIRLKEGLINNYYLAIFLNSKYGLLQSLRKASGGVQSNINFEDIKSIKIPIPSRSFQQKIEKMVKEAERKRKLADERYKEAEEILNKELGLENLDLSTQKTFEAKFSEAENRFDPEYYQPKYKRIIQLLKSGKRRNRFELYDLDKILTVKRGSLIDDGYYWSTGIPYIRIKDLTSHGISSNDFAYINKYQAEIGEHETIKEGDQLLTVIGATVGKICRVPKEFEGSFFSNNICRLRLKKEFSFRIDTIYLESVLRSIVCQSQILRNATQTAQPKLNDVEVRNMIIPILPKSTQQKISLLIQESMKLRREAKKLIDRAKQEVEAMVEEK